MSNISLEELTTDTFLVDPPDGWRHGFPKYFTPTLKARLPDRQWFIDNHYPGWKFDQNGGRYRIIGISEN